MAAVEKAQFTFARGLFNQQQFKKAIPAYIDVLNLFPEGETPVSDAPDIPPVVVKAKSLASTPVTFSPNVTVKSTESAFVGSPPTRVMVRTSGGVLSTV